MPFRAARVKLGIYAALGIPEVWRHDGTELAVLQLQEDGKYLATNQSAIFPGVSVKKLSQLLERRHSTDENELHRSFQDWVRKQLGK